MKEKSNTRDLKFMQEAVNDDVRHMERSNGKLSKMCEENGVRFGTLSKAPAQFLPTIG